jgi:L-2,4-diaminobutyrate decarboxylase
VSPTHRHLVRGIERADSIVWDAHKLLMMPALITAVMFRTGRHAAEAFAQHASYLFAGSRPDEVAWEIGQRTLECTKRMMAIELWCALRVHGEAWFAAVIDRQIALTRAFADRLAARTGFEVVRAPTCNIVCYRHVAPGLTGAALDAHNRALRTAVVEDGRFFIVGTELPGGYYLRSTIMNPLIEESDLDDLIGHLEALCQ